MKYTGPYYSNDINYIRYKNRPGLIVYHESLQADMKIFLSDNEIYPVGRAGDRSEKTVDLSEEELALMILSFSPLIIVII